MRRIAVACRQQFVRAASKPRRCRGLAKCTAIQHSNHRVFATASHGRRYSSSDNENDDGKSEQEYWPDGTPKQFSGKESWKNWINFDSEFREPTDELNRARHFFFEVDAKGRLHRLELDQPGKRFGQIRDGTSHTLSFSQKTGVWLWL